MLDQQNTSLLEACAPKELVAQGIAPASWRALLPFEWRDAIRVLGVLFCPLLTFRGHISALIRRARVRRHVLTCLFCSNWGLEAGILRTTRNALLVSLTRFGLVTVGSGAYEAELKALEVRHTNVVARRVLGLGATARLETLFSTSDLLSAHNLCLRSCAAMLGRGFRASNRILQKRLAEWTENAYGVTSWAS